MIFSERGVTPPALSSRKAPWNSAAVRARLGTPAATFRGRPRTQSIVVWRCKDVDVILHHAKGHGEAMPRGLTQWDTATSASHLHPSETTVSGEVLYIIDVAVT